MEKEPRYVVCRTIGQNTLWYWQRKSFKTERLSDNPHKRRQQADALNSMAEKDKVPDLSSKDAVRDVVRAYEKTKRYERLASGTKTYYNRYLREILRVFGPLPFRQLSRRVVLGFITEGRNAGEQHKVRGVMSVLFEQARLMELVDANQAERLNLETPTKRSEIWEPADIEAFLAAAEMHEFGGLARRYFQICRFTAQRPGDTAKMQWSQYAGHTIRLTQQKTRKLVDVPCHLDLHKELDMAPRESIYMFASDDGTPYPAWKLGTWEREIRDLCGLSHLQIRDLRRTAMVRMAEAGAEITDIAAVSGHTITATQQILETYIPRTKKMAERAILAWEVKKPT